MRQFLWSNEGFKFGQLKIQEIIAQNIGSTRDFFRGVSHRWLWAFSKPVIWTCDAIEQMPEPGVDNNVLCGIDYDPGLNHYIAISDERARKEGYTLLSSFNWFGRRAGKSVNPESIRLAFFPASSTGPVTSARLKWFMGIYSHKPE